MLLDKLKDIRIVKQNYFVLQHRFYAELSKRFPHIMNSDMSKVINKLENELHILLCASLRYKSIAIPLSASDKYGSRMITVKVQRSVPGFYYPQSQRGETDIYYMNLAQYITDKNNMNIIKNENEDGDKDHLLVALSELKKIGKRVISKKLDIYFKFLREIMAYRSKFLCYTGHGYQHNITRTFSVKQLAFNIQCKSLEIVIFSGDKKNEVIHFKSNDYSPYHNNFSYEEYDDDILRMLDYSGEYNKAKCFDKEVHDRLKFFINNYKEIYAKLEFEETIKCKAYKNCLNFLKQIETHTLPFKVLNIITKQ